MAGTRPALQVVLDSSGGSRASWQAQGLRYRLFWIALEVPEHHGRHQACATNYLAGRC
jgi:hypothetical protein